MQRAWCKLHLCALHGAPLHSARVHLALIVTVACALALSASQVPVFRAGVDLVNVSVTITDRKDHLVTGLKAEDFEVYEDGVRQAVTFFSAGDAGRGQAADLHLGLLLDVSESMGDDVNFTRTAAIKFLNTLVDAVDITVVDFDTEVRAARFSQDQFARVVERIRMQKTAGLTALYDAIGLYLDGAAAQEGRTIMLLYTDGGDTRSSMRYSELLDLLKASGVTIYVIGELDHQSASSRERARVTLSTIAATTGGEAFFPGSAKELDRVYEKVLAEIRAQYSLGYVSSNAATDGEWRKVDIKLSNKAVVGGRVRARRGYFAPYRSSSKP